MSRSVKETGDDEEERDEVLAVSITPVHSGKPGYDVKTRRPTVERSGTRTRGGEYDGRLRMSGGGPFAGAIVYALPCIR